MRAYRPQSQSLGRSTTYGARSDIQAKVKLMRPGRQWYSVTTRSKMNSFNYDAVNTDLNAYGQPIYGQGNFDAEHELFLNDRRALRVDNFAFSMLPNFGFWAGQFMGEVYLGGTQYGPTTDDGQYNNDNRQMHMYQWGNAVVSDKPLGLGRIPS